MRILLLTSFFITLSSAAFSVPINTSTTTTTQQVDEIRFSARFITAQYKYTEPEVMNIKGALYGVGFDGETLANSGLVLRGEADLLAGNPRYDGALIESNIPVSHVSKDYYYEIRGLIGKEVPQTSNMNFVWLSGLGHRYFNDKGQSKSAYEREQTYNYIPLLGALNIEASHSLMVKPYVEIDLFLNGQNKSHLEDVDSSLPTLKFKQESGFGSRFGLVISKQFNTMMGFARLDYTSWSIDASDVKFGFVEPKNKTEMTALAMGLFF